MQDIRLTDDYDLFLKNGDLAIAESSGRHIEHLLIAAQGEYKESPLTGCDIQKAKYGKIDRMLDRHVRVQMEADGFHLEQLAITENGIQIKGKYNEKNK
uniref:hypothetical protein n=1 Tax=Ornithobacterium rhinotracheale TaxID=28251 RepID=UPI0039A53388